MFRVCVWTNFPSSCLLKMSILVNSEGLLGRSCFCWDHLLLESVSGWGVQQDLRSEGSKMHFFFSLPPEVQRDEHSVSSE